MIQLWTGDWVKRTKKMNISVGEKNCIDRYGEKKWLVRTSRNQ